MGKLDQLNPAQLKLSFGWARLGLAKVTLKGMGRGVGIDLPSLQDFTIFGTVW